MWELDCEEGWAPKNWCFWTVVLEKTLESPLDFKEIQPVHSEGDQPWDSFGRNDAKAEAPVLWPPHVKLTRWKRLWCWEDWGQEEKGMTEDEMAGWHHWVDAHEFGWTPGVGDGQGGLVCCDSWGRQESDMTEQLNWKLYKDKLYKHFRFQILSPMSWRLSVWALEYKPFLSHSLTVWSWVSGHDESYQALVFHSVKWGS